MNDENPDNGTDDPTVDDSAFEIVENSQEESSDEPEPADEAVTEDAPSRTPVYNDEGAKVASSSEPYKDNGDRSEPANLDRRLSQEEKDRRQRQADEAGANAAAATQGVNGVEDDGSDEG